VAFSETWTGTTGAAWPAGWTHVSGTSTIQTNTGRQVTAATAYAEAWDYQTGTADGEVLAQVQVSGNTERYVEVAARFSTASPNTGSGYVAHFDHAGNAVIYRFNSGASASLGTAGGAGFLTITASAWYWVRFRWEGSALSAKFWPATGGEPGSWSVTATDSTYSAAGVVGLRTQTGNTTGALTFNWDDLTYATVGALPQKSILLQQAVNRSYTY